LIADPLNCTLRLNMIFHFFFLHKQVERKLFRRQLLGLSSLCDAVFIQVLDRTGPLILNLDGTPSLWFTWFSWVYFISVIDNTQITISNHSFSNLLYHLHYFNSFIRSL
jgi:hypothetical protein